MDFISHTLWGGIVFGRKSKRYFFWALFFGGIPDFFSFGIFMIMQNLGFANKIDWSKGHPSMDMIPNYVHTLYDMTHSLIIASIVILIVCLIMKKIFWPMFAWVLHILVDIPTHSKTFFATPFLWPLSNYQYDGIAWSKPYIFYPNIILLLIIYISYYFYKKRNNVLKEKL